MSGRGEKNGPPTRASRGVALINALVIVAAIAAISAGLLMRAEAARARLETLFAADQVALYLDAAEQLTQALIGPPPPDDVTHLGQGWAVARRGESIDRGTVGWQVDDLQGRFNLVWLEDVELAAVMGAALVELARGVGMNAEQAERLANAASFDPARRERAFAGGPSRAPEVPLLTPAQLRLVPGIDAAALERLLPLLASLPGNATVNVNTLRPEVLVALFPSLPPGTDTAFVAGRAERPFANIDEFYDLLEPLLDDADYELLELLFFDVGSDWFEARLEARLDTTVLRRSVVLRRPEGDGVATVVLSLPETD